MIATLWWPSLNPFEPPVPFVLIVYVVALVAIDYYSGFFSLTPEALLKILVLVTPITTLFLLLLSDADVQAFILVGVHKYRTFPDLTDYLANYTAHCFGALILTRAFKSQSVWTRAVFKAAFIVLLGVIFIEVAKGPL